MASLRTAYTIAAIVPLGLIISALLDPTRNWALSFGAYLDTTTTIIWLGTATLFVLAAAVIKLPVPAEKQSPPTRRDLTIAVACTAVTALLFIVFRTRFHFLGDGYALLATLATESPHLKFRQVGETMLHYWLTRAAGGGEDGALFSFRFLSILSGALVLIATVFFARRLNSRAAFWLFFFGIATGGQMLLFFGYVEQYSIFNLGIAAFLFTGLLVADGGLSRFWVLVPLAVTIILHILGLMLILPALYLLIAPETRKRLARRVSVPLRWTLAVLLLILATVAYWQLTNTVSFVGLAFLPIFPHELTFDNYWLFSLSHLIDYLNLLIVSGPALIVLVPLIWSGLRRAKQNERPPGAVFLLITSAVALLLAFTVDPKLGMPRDIDLLTFLATVLTVVAWYLFTTVVPISGATQRVGIIAILLSAIVLSGRVATLQSEEPAVSQLNHHLSLYHSRSRSGYVQLSQLYRETGRRDQYDTIKREWMAGHPAVNLLDRAEALGQQGRCDEAIVLARQSIQHDSMYPDPYVTIGNCLVKLGRYTEAIPVLRTALALNPDHIIAWNALGVALGNTGRQEESIVALEKALVGDTLYAVAEFNKANAHFYANQMDQYRYHLRRAVESTTMPPRVYLTQLRYWLEERKFDSSRWLYHSRLVNKLSPEQRNDVESRFPQLKTD